MSTVIATPSTSAYASANTSFQPLSKPGFSCMLVMTADIVGVSVALWAFYGRNITGRYVAPGDWLLLWPLVPLFLILYWCFDLYPGISVSPVDELRRICLATTGGFASISAILALLQGEVRPQVICLPASICASILVLAMRAGIRRVGSRFSWWGYPVAVFGCGDVARSMLQRLKSQPHLGLRPVVVVTDRVVGRVLDGLPVFKLEHLTWISLAGVRHAIVAAPELSRSEFIAVMERGCNAFPHLILIPDTDSVWRVGSCTEDITGILGLQLGNNLLQNGPRIVKRMLDLALSIVLTIFLFPLLTIIVLLVVVDSGFPVFYSQERLGRGGKTFRIWKFRTMAQNSEQILGRYLMANLEARKEWSLCQKLLKDPRITRVGKFLRRASLDELPQLWNVINGEMSLVGPRPIVKAEADRYEEHFFAYIKITPGLTGMWQVSGRNRTTYAERVAFDAYYVRNWSVWMDLYLLGKTVGVVLTGDGAY